MDAKKVKREKPAKKEKLVKKGKAEKPHPSSKAGPGFSIRLSDEKPPKIEISSVNKKGHAFAVGVRDGDILTIVNGKSVVENVPFNDVKAMLVAPCGTRVPITVHRVSANGTQALQFELILDFTPLVKAMAGGKPVARGQSAEISLALVDSDKKRELFFLAGALPALCKLLTDPKAAAQVVQAIKSLQNMMQMAGAPDLSIAIESIGKPLVSLIEKGGLAKKLIAMDVLCRIALTRAPHRVLVAAGVIESCCALPKGIIAIALPKWTPKGWKAGKKATGLETKAAKLLGCLARMSNGARERINNATNNGVDLLVRMMQGKAEPAGALNEIPPDGRATACEALQYLALNGDCRNKLESTGALPTITSLLRPQQRTDGAHGAGGAAPGARHVEEEAAADPETAEAAEAAAAAAKAEEEAV